jgi:hypothetical protein
VLWSVGPSWARRQVSLLAAVAPWAEAPDDRPTGDAAGGPPGGPAC